MQCEDVLELAETLAEGEVPGPEVSRHLQVCSRCTAAMTRARRIHDALRTLAVPSPAQDFTSTVVGRTRSLRWQSEQRFDWWFNAAMAAGLAIIALGIWGLMHVTGLAAVTTGTVDFVGRSVPELFEQVKPRLALYGTAAGFVVGSLAIWWWLERGGRPQRVV